MEGCDGREDVNSQQALEPRWSARVRIVFAIRGPDFQTGKNHLIWIGIRIVVKRVVALVVISHTAVDRGDRGLTSPRLDHYGPASYSTASK